MNHAHAPEESASCIIGMHTFFLEVWQQALSHWIGPKCTKVMLKCCESWRWRAKLLTLAIASHRQRNTVQQEPVKLLTWVVDDKLARILHKPPDRDAQCRQLRGGDEQLLHG